MSKARAKTNPPTAPVCVTPPLDPVHVAVLADQVQRGDVVQTASIEEFGALLDELKRRGYVLHARSEAAKTRAPFTFEVIREENIPKI